MPERGPVQFLLLFFRSRARIGWKLGLAAAFIVLLGLLPGGEGIYHKAKSELAQSLRQAAWKRVLAREPEQAAWPWDNASPAANPVVPRLGLSAALHYEKESGGRSVAPSRSWHHSGLDGARDPHLAFGNVAIGDRITVTTADGSTKAYRVTGGQFVDAPESGESNGMSAPTDGCSQLNSSLAGALRLIIEAIHADRPAGPATNNEEQKL